MIDIVYALGSGSKWNDKEIRYSLRSVEKHLTNVRNVYIVGQCPDFLKNVIHFPYIDYHRWKETRIALKILNACHIKGMSDNFLFMNDDHFLISDYDAAEFPYYWKETLSATAQARRFEDAYRKSLTNTYGILTNKGLMSYNFDVHCPILYNKERFIEFYKKYDWETNYSFVIKSLYCNTERIKGERISDCKICSPLLNLDDLKDEIKGRMFFSIGDRVLQNDKMEELLKELYPDKSKYEK